jgi:hypothetical protein
MSSLAAVPAPVRERPPRILALHGAPSAVVQAMLADFAARLAGEGTRVAGVVEMTEAADGPVCGRVVLRDLASGAEFAISQDLGPGSVACNLDADGLAQACAAVERGVAAGADLVILSKFGKQEAARGGLGDAFRAAVAADLPVLTFVSRGQADAWRRFAGPLSALAPADIEAVEEWWRGFAA